MRNLDNIYRITFSSNFTFRDKYSRFCPTSPFAMYWPLVVNKGELLCPIEQFWGTSFPGQWQPKKGKRFGGDLGPSPSHAYFFGVYNIIWISCKRQYIKQCYELGQLFATDDQYIGSRKAQSSKTCSFCSR